jgi:lipopolysaccharide/colanic/teichoic acid biosynthesis glycosyltransferase
VVAEKQFRDVLVRERKRADRFARPFVLVLVSVKAGRPADSSAWQSVIEALHSAKRDTDVLGWFERESSLGLIVPEIEISHSPFIREVESRVSLALAKHLDVIARADLSIQLHRHAGPTPVAQQHTSEPLLRDLYVSPRTRVLNALKRLLDIAASAALLALVSPLFLLISALVKLKSPGPVFFKQERVGELGRPFKMLKFRTMHVNNDASIHKEFVSKLIQGATPNGGDGGDNAFKIVNDPRVTAIGSVLRKTSLDELPQLWNVLRGDMSLVGPRPPLQYEVGQYKPWHYRRVLEAKPGMTGLWQVSGRSRTNFDDMVRLDLRYAKHVSPWTDIKILLATPKAVISGKGAV